MPSCFNFPKHLVNAGSVTLFRKQAIRLEIVNIYEVIFGFFSWEKVLGVFFVSIIIVNLILK